MRLSDGSSIKTTEDHGSALVEAALVLPFLLLLTFGIWTTARAWNIQNTLDHAVREGARYGATEEPWSVGTSDVAVQGVVDNVLDASSINPSDPSISSCIELIPAGDSGCGGAANTTGADQVYVSIEYADYDLNFLFFSFGLDLDATAVARHESD